MILLGGVKGTRGGSTALDHLAQGTVLCVDERIVYPFTNRAGFPDPDEKRFVSLRAEGILMTP